MWLWDAGENAGVDADAGVGCGWDGAGHNGWAGVDLVGYGAMGGYHFSYTAGNASAAANSEASCRRASAVLSLRCSIVSL